MLKLISPLFILLLTFCSVSASTQAQESAVTAWQKDRLLKPTDKTVTAEKDQQQVFIYEGLQIADVEKAMDTQFDRVEHMMFVSTVLPPTAEGVPQREEDGCD